jgi:adenine-specific DNA-methyltransferase
MGFRYIGSKARVAGAISALLGSPKEDYGVFVDVFCGTGVVAEHAARLGWSVRVNDHLRSAVTVAVARLCAAGDVPFSALGSYREVVDTLNRLPGREGFIWREYSPASADVCGVERRYFTQANAAKIDAIRQQISEWSEEGMATHTEERLLVADLLSAVSRVANIAGTYGCFLSMWTPGALGSLVVRPRTLFPHPVDVEVFNTSAEDVLIGENDVAYLDPPYTKRQYAAYYHILETIAIGDTPSVGGITGLRPWKDKASDFCYRVRALLAIHKLVSHIKARRVLLSYNSQGHVRLDALKVALSGLGDLKVHELAKVGRYRPNQAASNGGSSVREYLFELDKTGSVSGKGLT